MGAKHTTANAIFFVACFQILLLSLLFLFFCSFLNFAHSNGTRQHTLTHTYTDNTLSQLSSDSNESASTNARLTDFVAMLQLLVLEIDENDK